MTFPTDPSPSASDDSPLGGDREPTPEPPAADAGAEVTEVADATEAGTDRSATPHGRRARGARRGATRGKTRRPPPVRAPEPPALTPEQDEVAVAAARERIVSEGGGSRDAILRTLDRLAARASIPFLARYRRGETGGLDERRLRQLRDRYDEVLVEERRRAAIEALLRERESWNDDVAAQLAAASDIAAMDDLAAAHLTVTMSRSLVARGHGLEALATAIRTATEATPLSDLAQPFVREGGEPATLDEALGGARDILAEEIVLDPVLRGRLRSLFHKQAILRIAARTERTRHGGAPEGAADDAEARAREVARDADAAPAPFDGDLDPPADESPASEAAAVSTDGGEDAPGAAAASVAAETEPASDPAVARGKRRGREARDGRGRPAAANAGLAGLEGLAIKIPPLKWFAARRAERQRQVTISIEPPEDAALAIVADTAVPADHPFARFLRAAAEDGYRRLLKPLLQAQLRAEIQARAEDQLFDGFERTLRNNVLAPRGGAVRTMGLRPDVIQGHRWCAVDEHGLPVGSGQLPHEPTAGRDACITELREVLRRYDVDVVAVGTGGGRAEARRLLSEAFGDAPRTVVEVHDGGTRSCEQQGKLELPDCPPVAPEQRGALSIARRFQDPLRELLHIEPKALGLGPHQFDVSPPRLKRMVHDVFESALAFAGYDPNVADADLLRHAPGFDRDSAQAFLVWRNSGARLESKAELATIDGVGPDVAEQAIGFMRLPQARDMRDRTQLHPEQFAIVDRMAEQIGTDVETLFAEPRARADVRLDPLVDGSTPLPALKGVLWQLTAGINDPRPIYVANPIFIPETMGLADLKPGQEVQGRVIRAAPFGVFVDVGLRRIEALLPLAHIGDRPGTEPTTVAPLGAVITARVIEADPQRRKLTLSMRRDAFGRGPYGGRAPGPRGHGHRDGGDRAPFEGRPPRGDDRGPRREGDAQRGGRGPRERDDAVPRRMFSAASSGGGARGAGRPDRPERSGRGGRPDRPQRGGGGGGPRGAGRDGGGFSFERGGGRGFDRDVPRRISLGPDTGAPADAEVVDESLLSPEELLKRKLEQLQRKLQRPGA